MQKPTEKLLKAPCSYTIKLDISREYIPRSALLWQSTSYICHAVYLTLSMHLALPTRRHSAYLPSTAHSTATYLVCRKLLSEQCLAIGACYWTCPCSAVFNVTHSPCRGSKICLGMEELGGKGSRRMVMDVNFVVQIARSPLPTRLDNYGYETIPTT